MHRRQVSGWEFRSAEHGWNVREGVLHEATWRPEQPLDAEPSFIKRRSNPFKHQTFDITASELKYCAPPTAHAALTLDLFSDLTAFRPHTPIPAYFISMLSDQSAFFTHQHSPRLLAASFIYGILPPDSISDDLCSVRSKNYSHLPPPEALPLCEVEEWKHRVSAGGRQS